MRLAKTLVAMQAEDQFCLAPVQTTGRHNVINTGTTMDKLDGLGIGAITLFSEF